VEGLIAQVGEEEEEEEEEGVEVNHGKMISYSF
jgi:hypothetical protein